MQSIYPFFSQNPLDRLDATRRDEKKFKKLQNLSTSKFLLFFEEKILTYDNKCFFNKEDTLTCKYNDDEIVLLGEFNGIYYFCIAVKSFSDVLSCTSLRDFALDVDEKFLGILAQGASVLNWHSSHQYCSYCGALTTLSHTGWRRNCTQCKRQHFPKVDPVVIMLVTHEEYCLLGKGVRFEGNRYSCLAGYMESGESIEDAARRELFEESGIIGGEVSYIASQPWPFPSTIMIGLSVKAETTKITIDPHEIADARWFHKDDVKKMLEGDESFGISLPGKIAIARNLLEYWINQ